MVTTGSSAGFVLAFLALFDAGDRVLLPQPGYPCYRQILSALSCVPRFLETNAASRWAPTAAMIDEAAANEAIAGLLVASPANPTGTMIGQARLAELFATCERHGIAFLSDEIYHGLTYDEPAATALSFSGDAIVINSFSKYFSMTGWRIGWLVVPEALVRTFERLCQNLYIAPPAVSQVAALAAFEATDELEALKRGYQENRDLLVKELPAIGFPHLLPADGAFYLYADVSHLTADSLGFCRKLLAEAGVAATPGLDFDPARGSHFVRFSYAGSHSSMREALDRIGRWRQRNQ